MTLYRTDGAKPHRKDGFYGTREWLKLRNKIAKRDRHTCRMCGRFCPGRKQGIVDHIIPRTKRPDLALDPNNLQYLCFPCHNSTKAAMERRADRPTIGVDGFPEGWGGNSSG